MPLPLDVTALDLASDPELGPLLAACPDIEPLRFHDGECLVTEGDRGQDVFIVRKGALVVEKALPDGTPRPLAQLMASPEAPLILGEMAYFGAQRRTATVRSVGSCQTLRLQPAHLDRIMAGFPNLTRILCRQFTSRLQEANDELRDLRARFHLAPERRMVQPGEAVIRKGEPAEAVFQLVMGTVRVEGADGSRILKAEDLPGGFLGLEAFLRHGEYPTTALAEETCFLAVITTAHREAFLRAHPALALRLLEGAAR